jgi:hypothetical protein
VPSLSIRRPVLDVGIVRQLFVDGQFAFNSKLAQNLKRKLLYNTLGAISVKVVREDESVSYLMFMPSLSPVSARLLASSNIIPFTGLV